MTDWATEGEGERAGIGLYVEAALVGIPVSAGYLIAIAASAAWLSSWF
jgi:hypothetical protein